MRVAALLLLVILASGAAFAQLPSAPPYETTLEASASLGRVEPGQTAATPVIVSLVVRGELQHGEVRIRPLAPPQAEAWTVTLEPEEILVTLASPGPGIPFNSYRGEFTLKAHPHAGVAADDAEHVAFTFVADATNLTREARAEVGMDLTVAPHPQLVLASWPTVANATLGQPTTVEHVLRNTGNTNLLVQVSPTWTMSDECEITPGAPVEIAPGQESPVPLVITCREAPTFRDPRVLVTIEGHAAAFLEIPRPVSVENTLQIHIVDEQGRPVEPPGEKLDLAWGGAAGAVAALALATRMRRRLP